MGNVETFWDEAGGSCALRLCLKGWYGRCICNRVDVIAGTESSTSSNGTTMIDNIPNPLLVIAAVALVAFVVANAFASGGGGLDADEIEQVRTLLAEGDAELVDVRTPQEFARNGLDGAKNVPVQQLAERLDEAGAKDEPVVVYCRSGNRSARAAQILEKAGYEEVYDLGAHSTAKKVVEAAQ